MVYTPECNGLLSVVNNENAEELLKRVGNQPKINVKVPALSLNNILEQCWHPENEIDIAFIDLEGYEEEALKGIDLDKWTINFILVEQLKKDSAIAEILQKHYNLVEVLGEHDYLYKRK